MDLFFYLTLLVPICSITIIKYMHSSNTSTTFYRVSTTCGYFVKGCRCVWWMYILYVILSNVIVASTSHIITALILVLLTIGNEPEDNTSATVVIRNHCFTGYYGGRIHIHANSVITSWKGLKIFRRYKRVLLQACSIILWLTTMN
jgi:hypothetical protein